MRCQRLVAAGVGFAVTLLLGSPSHAQAFSFAPGIEYPLPAEAYGAFTADVNGDGRSDVVVGRVVYRAGLGGDLLPPVNTALPSLRHVGDFDRDGWPDLLHIESYPAPQTVVRGEWVPPLVPGRVIVRLGLGDGTFSDPVVSWLPNGYVSTVIQDVSGDGQVDVFGVAQGYYLRPNWWTVRCAGVGDGTFRCDRSGSRFGFVGAIAAGDVDGDGRTDVFYEVEGRIYWKGEPLYLGMRDVRLDVADVDGDGFGDLLVSTESQARVLFSAGNGTFRDVHHVSSLTKWGSVADVNGDGRADMTSAAAGEVSLELGDGAGEFATAAVVDTGHQYVDQALLADVDGDGRPDIVTVSSDTRTYPRASFLSVFLNTSSRPQAVTWAERVNVTSEDVALLKTGGCHGCGDAYAVSEDVLASGGGALSFTIGDPTTQLVTGFTATGSAQALDFALCFQGGPVASVHEGGVYRTDVPFMAGDRFRIAVTAEGGVTYWRNGRLVYRSLTAAALPMRVGAPLASTGARLQGVLLHHADGTAAPPLSTGTPVLSLVSGASNPVTLAWTAVGEPPTGYTLLVGSQSGAQDVGVLPMGRATSITAPAPLGPPLYVRVVAHRPSGDAMSNEVGVTVGVRGAAAAPTLAPAVVSGRTVTLTWTASSPSVSVQARHSHTGTVIASAPVTGRTVTVADVAPGKYYVSVVALSDGEQSAESNVIEVLVR